MTKLSLVALFAASVTLSVPVLATQNNVDATVTSTVENASVRAGVRARGSTRTFDAKLIVK